MRRFLKAALAEQEAIFMLGYREVNDVPSSSYDSAEQPIKCFDCHKFQIAKGSDNAFQERTWCHRSRGSDGGKLLVLVV